MPRIRTVKPQHWADKELPKIQLGAHLLWIGTWNFSDDKGIFEADPLLIKANIFPRRTDVRVEQINQWLDQLVKARYIVPFSHDGESYYINRTFGTHQKIDKPQKSKIPETLIKRLIQGNSTNDTGTLDYCSSLDSIGKERKGKESISEKFFFSLNGQVIREAPSEWFKKNNQSFFEQWQMSHKLEISQDPSLLRRTFAKMDEDIGYSFNGNTHVLNKFKSIYLKELKEKSIEQKQTIKLGRS